MEEQCERRIEMLTKSMKKSRKRKKIDRTEDEDDSYVSSILFHAEKVKVKVNAEIFVLSVSLSLSLSLSLSFSGQSANKIH